MSKSVSRLPPPLGSWTRDLSYHPHLHWLMPGGGLREEKGEGRPGSGKAAAPRWKWKRYTESGTGLTKHKTLPSDDFILRVLRHALPRGFRRIRYYGWLHPSAMRRFLRVQTLLRVRLFLGDRPGHKTAPAPCPHCGGVLELLATNRPRGPPRP